MAYELPCKKVTPIPNTEPPAVPSLWNERYTEIDSNFARVAGFDAAGVCSTDALTSVKEVQCPYFVLSDRAIITVKFFVTNEAESVSLDVNSTGAKPVVLNGKPIKKDALQKDNVYAFMYDGTSWNVVGGVSGAGDDCLKLTGGTITGDLVVEGSLTINGESGSGDNAIITKKALENRLTELNNSFDLLGTKATVDGVYQAFTQFATDQGIE